MTYFWLELALVLIVAFVWAMSVRGAIRVHRDLRYKADVVMRRRLTVTVNLILLLATAAAAFVIGGILTLWSK